MEQGLIDIRNKAKEVAEGLIDVFSDGTAPYGISCATLIAILDKLEATEQELEMMTSYWDRGIPNFETSAVEFPFELANEVNEFVYPAHPIDDNWPDREELGTFDEPAP